MAVINGTAADDVLNGTINRDIINGQAGADTMAGGLEADTYYVDNLLDVIVEVIGEGTDWIYTTISYALSDNVEHGRILGNGDIDLIGNEWDNTLIGNSGDNVLNGGAGADTMSGGAGNDTYWINMFRQDGINDTRGVETDVIVDSSGVDTVRSSAAALEETDAKYILQNGLEHALLDTTNINMTLIGNKVGNILRTSEGNDTIDGGRGADTMDGGDGGNTFFVDHKNDTIIDIVADIDEDDIDTVFVSTNYTLNAGALIEKMVAVEGRAVNITGNEFSNSITGNSKRNILRGGDGNDVLICDDGKDMLYGDAGADTFLFDADATFLKPVTIADFNAAAGDKLLLADILDYTEGDAVTSYVKMFEKGRDTIVTINTEGNGDPRDFVSVAVLKGVLGLTGETALVLSGNLIVELPS